ncbi:MAG: hypothetical protein KGJ58_03995 [Patescibacteria group bacterium]|nr:hypothetical protein [Patescibacteria group bacterium]MDE1988437.1 hypothetical protein [Patescibacteria group bacterium]MDE2218583.1 hypothetical protein [Patescibacteria group bacterium]
MEKPTELIILDHIEGSCRAIYESIDYDVLSEQCCVVEELCDILSEAKDNISQDCKIEITKKLTALLKEKPAKHEWPEFIGGSCRAIDDLLLRLL